MIRQLQGCCLLSLWKGSAGGVTTQGSALHLPAIRGIRFLPLTHLVPSESTIFTLLAPKSAPFFRNFCFSVLKAANLVDFGSQKCVLKYDKKCKVSVFQGQSAVPSFLFPLSLRCELSFPLSGLPYAPLITLGTVPSHLSWQLLPVLQKQLNYAAVPIFAF